MNLQTTVHNQYPAVNHYMTEHSGGTWIANQQTEDMNNLIDYTRNWSKSWVKWSLGLDQNMLPYVGAGCNVCTGLVTIQRGGSRAGQVDKTVEYYTMGHLTKFVKPGAARIESNANASVKNVAWKNPDGSKALIAYNTTGGSQSVRVNWGSQSFVYTLPTKTSATFTWSGTQGGGGGGTGTAITGLGGKCIDVAGASTADGTAVNLYDCNGTRRAAVDPAGRRHGPGARQVPRRERRLDRRRREDPALDLQRQWRPAMDLHGRQGPGESTGEQVPRRHRQQLRERHALQIWTCTGAANQKWNA